MAFEVLKSVYDGVKERLQNPFSVRNATPFAGTFLITFVLYNWKLFYTLFNFDPEDTRVDKIDIIQSYLNDISCWERFGWPLLWAFASIIFYYLFNNISLGFTIFFNRWFKSLVLHITDRSKNIPREYWNQVNKSLNAEIQKNDGFVKSIADLKAENDILKSKDVEYLRISSENDQLKVSNNQLEAQIELERAKKDEFKILQAKYGKEDRYLDVTNTLIAISSNIGSFIVNDEALNVDPFPYEIKELVVLYSSFGTVREISAIQGSRLEFRDQHVIIMETVESRKNNDQISERQKLSEVFKGVWEVTYTKAGTDKTNSDIVTIDNKGRYYVNGELTFMLIGITVDVRSNEMVYTKINPEAKIPVSETLRILREGVIRGIYADGSVLHYRKIKW